MSVVCGAAVDRAQEESALALRANPATARCRRGASSTRVRSTRTSRHCTCMRPRRVPVQRRGTPPSVQRHAAVPPPATTARYPRGAC